MSLSRYSQLFCQFLDESFWVTPFYKRVNSSIHATYLVFMRSIKHSWNLAFGWTYISHNFIHISQLPSVDLTLEKELTLWVVTHSKRVGVSLSRYFRESLQPYFTIQRVGRLSLPFTRAHITLQLTHMLFLEVAWTSDGNHATYNGIDSHPMPFKSGSEMEQARLAERPSKRVACLITLETSDKGGGREDTVVGNLHGICEQHMALLNL